MGGVQMQRLLRAHVVVVFGATSRIGKVTIEALAAAHEGVTVVAAVEQPKDARVKRLRRATGCHAVQCDFADARSLQRAVRHADAVLLVPALSPSGTQFSKRVLDACVAEEVARIVLISSLLAADDYWRQGDARSLGYEVIEAHARAVTNNCVALRIPLLMETLLYCRDEVVFASRFLSCFQPTTPVPCIAVTDVARAACEVLTKPTTKFNGTYSLANAEVTCSPVEIERLLSHALGRRIRAKYVSDARFTQALKDKGASELVAVNTIRFKNYIEMSTRGAAAGPAALQTPLPPAAEGLAAEGPAVVAAEAKAPLPLTRVGFSNDFRTLTKRALTTPRQWLEATRVYFERSAENQMQLFVMGSGEGLFQEIERLVAQQVTAPLAVATDGDNSGDDGGVGEAAIPTATGAAVHSKATFCTIKTVPGGRQRQHASGVAPGAAASPMVQLLEQLTPADVVLFVPPLRFGAAECMEVLRVVVDACRRARAWGIVVVSSIFTGRGWADSVNRMGEMEKFVETSGVPYAIVRLPLFMEYFLALTPTPEPPRGITEEEKEVEAEPGGEDEERGGLQHQPPQRDRAASTSAAAGGWPLLGRALATTPQYLISTADAAKALVSVAYTFPLHRHKVRNVYTERRTMCELEQLFQRHAYKGARIDFARVDALRETLQHEFWRVAYWTKSHVKQFLETEVQLSGNHTPPLAMDESFEDITECPPITLDKWAARNSKSLAHALGNGNRHRHQQQQQQRSRKTSTAATSTTQAATSEAETMTGEIPESNVAPHEKQEEEASSSPPPHERPHLHRTTGEVDLRPIVEEAATTETPLETGEGK